ncbi:PQQ-dependent sugar dehydrogenase [Actinomadura flavalba]|uniref:PQQ-dependent sugar dehydrogenase n=1 Tax=Actinomadura flavalba TaxID=1120938 RepID=UPI00036506CE|nr:PQQ-dependent sugar dehydrogenase [Actinomadura flavalba]
MLRIRCLIVLVALAFTAACGGGDDPGGAPSASGSASPTGTTGTAAPGEPAQVARGLEVPWGLAFLPGGDALVTERDSARLLRVASGGKVTEIARVPGVRPGGEGGLLGVAVSPDYARNKHVYLYFTAANDNRVLRFVQDDDGLSSPVEIVTGIPKAGNHNGGAVAFGPDGDLYVATGDAGRQDLAQDRNSLGGKILRLTPDGDEADGNPFGNAVWTLGHRNVQGLAWDGRKQMYATEFGQNETDEINRIERGKNYGWPEVEGAGGPDRFTDPIIEWTTAEASPSGLAFADGSLWAAALRGERLWQVPLNADGGADKSAAKGLFQGDYGRLRGVARAPDGSVWFTTSNRDGRGSPDGADDRVLRLTFGG